MLTTDKSFKVWITTETTWCLKDATAQFNAAYCDTFTEYTCRCKRYHYQSQTYQRMQRAVFRAPR